MCTSLAYTDATGAVYLGRTLELDVEEPYFAVFVPVGETFESAAEGHDPVSYTATHSYLGVAAPGRLPTEDAPLEPEALKVCEGLNDAGVTFSLLAYPSAGGGESSVEITRAVLQAADLGSWVLSQFATVAEVKAGLADQPVFLTRLAVVGNVEFPFHIVVHDATGASIVIEWHNGAEAIHDNPVGVMTNGPTFPWHLTNLRNWTHLTNVDRSSATFGSLELHQPDSGIATAALPGSNTSVGRFIRAVYYSNFAQKVADPDHALLTLSRIMNNFDRPRGITVDPATGGGEGVTFQGTSRDDGAPPSEYTSWTNLSDLSRGLFLLRTYDSHNYTRFDLGTLVDGANGSRVLPIATLDPMGGDGTQALLAATTP